MHFERLGNDFARLFLYLEAFGRDWESSPGRAEIAPAREGLDKALSRASRKDLAQDYGPGRVLSPRGGSGPRHPAPGRRPRLRRSRSRDLRPAPGPIAQGSIAWWRRKLGPMARCWAGTGSCSARMPSASRPRARFPHCARQCGVCARPRRSRHVSKARIVEFTSRGEVPEAEALLARLASSLGRSPEEALGFPAANRAPGFGVDPVRGSAGIRKHILQSTRSDPCAPR